MALIQSTAIPSGATDFELEQSLKFNEARSPYLNRTPSSASNRKTFTYSCWMKIGNISNDNNLLHARESANDRFHFLMSGNYLGVSYYVGGTEKWIRTTPLLRDPSAWYHIVLRVDTTQSTSTDRVRIYVNGEVQHLYTGQMPTQNWDLAVNNNVEHRIGQRISNNDYKIDGYLAEIHLVDGASLAPTSFGETGTYGEWKPIEYSGTYGTNGFYLPFKNDYTVEGFSTVIYPGNSVADHYIGGTGFKSDLTWLKHRNHGTAHQHNLFDSVRGAYKTIHSNSTEAEETLTDMLSSFKPDGFTLGTSDAINDSGVNYVSWNWDMGADTPTGFGCTVYKGNAGQLNVSGYGFQPDLVWIKPQSTGDHGRLMDSIRGSGSLSPNQTSAEETSSNNFLTKFNPDGFTINTADGGWNSASHTYVAWCWDMGNTTATNTSGSISSQVRANPTYGQSIISYSGNGTNNSTIGHGLSSAPEMVITKRRNNGTDYWAVYHASAGQGYLSLNRTDAYNSGNDRWGTNAPTSSLMNLGYAGGTNASGGTYISYAFHSVSGYSKFGSYSGTGSANNAVTLGFRPAFLMVKNTGASENWAIIDSTRSPLNPITKALKADVDDAEQDNAVNTVNFTDTGFSIVSTDARWNASSNNYIYMAFAGGMDSISDYNDTGSIDSRVKANTTYGQSIVSYTGNASAGATVGHGLSSAPEMIILKDRDGTTNWSVYHASNTAAPETEALALNTTDATSDYLWWNDTAPTNSLFSLGAISNTNANGNDFIAYCWHSVIL